MTDDIPHADDYPAGKILDLTLDTPESRIAKADFKHYQWEYFERLSNGSTGWGVSFIAYLELIKGWKHLGRRKFERMDGWADQP